MTGFQTLQYNDYFIDLPGCAIKAVVSFTSPPFRNSLQTPLKKLFRSQWHTKETQDGREYIKLSLYNFIQYTDIDSHAICAFSLLKWEYTIIFPLSFRLLFSLSHEILLFYYPLYIRTKDADTNARINMLGETLFYSYGIQCIESHPATIRVGFVSVPRRLSSCSQCRENVFALNTPHATK
jgi:hypothetical protein